MTHEEFKIVWLPLSSGFLALARHMLDDESDAADAVQDLYVRLWNARDALDRVESPQAYGATMTRNICLDRLRRRQARRAEGLEAVDGLLSLEGTDRRVISRESGEMLSRAMMKLPAKESELKKFYDSLKASCSCGGSCSGCNGGSCGGDGGCEGGCCH